MLKQLHVINFSALILPLLQQQRKVMHGKTYPIDFPIHGKYYIMKIDYR